MHFINKKNLKKDSDRNAPLSFLKKKQKKNSNFFAIQNLKFSYKFYKHIAQLYQK